MEETDMFPESRLTHCSPGDVSDRGVPNIQEGPWLLCWESMSLTISIRLLPLAFWYYWWWFPISEIGVLFVVVGNLEIWSRLFRSGSFEGSIYLCFLAVNLWGNDDQSVCGAGDGEETARLLHLSRYDPPSRRLLSTIWPLEHCTLLLSAIWYYLFVFHPRPIAPPRPKLYTSSTGFHLDFFPFWSRLSCLPNGCLYEPFLSIPGCFVLRGVCMSISFLACEGFFPMIHQLRWCLFEN